MDKIKSYAPHAVKAIRQEFLLKRAESLTGLKSGFPVAEAFDSQAPAYVVGSGASILDFNLNDQELESSLSVSLNDAIFLPFTPKFHSYEGSRIPEELDFP